MPRYKLTIEYDGTGLVGWQQQDNGPSVQAALQAAVKAFSGEDARIGGAGRTDAGVHALGQVAHLDLTREWDANRVREAMNAHLRGCAIAVLAVEQVADGFDARFSAVKRHYLYRIVNRRPPLALMQHRAWHVMQPLDASSHCVQAVLLPANSLLAGRLNVILTVISQQYVRFCVIRLYTAGVILRTTTPVPRSFIKELISQKLPGYSCQPSSGNVSSDGTDI